MTCRDVREYLFAFLDNELDATLSHEVQRHLDQCPECAREAEIERTIGKQLARKLRDEGAEASFDPASLRASLRPPKGQAAIGAGLGRRRRFFVGAGMGVAACLSIVVWLNRDHPRADSAKTRLGEVLVEDFRHFVEAGKPLEIVSSDAGRTSVWIRDRMRMDVSLPAVDGVGDRLIGARSCKLAGQPAAFAVYEVDGVKAAVIVLARSDMDVDRMRQVTHDGGTHWIDRYQGHTVLACRRGDLIYAAVSTLNESQLLKLMPGSHESH